MIERINTGGHPLHQWTNLFAISNQQDLSITYRLLKITGLPPGDHYDKSINQLVKAVRYEIQRPVALVRHTEAHSLAIPADAALPQLKQRLMPHLATLVPGDEQYSLDFGHLDTTTVPIATVFLQYALRTPLMRDQRLWGGGQSYYSKHPMASERVDPEVDTYPGFTWSIVSLQGRLCLAVDVGMKYIDHLWLPERLNGQDAQRYLRRHCLYHFGPQWYNVQLWGLTGASIAEQCFPLEGEEREVDVLTYTREKWQANPPLWIRDLDPDSPAILYHYPGNKKDRYGALALCKLVIPTSDAEAAGLHRNAILEPATRLRQSIKTVEAHFQHAELGQRTIRVSSFPLEVERRIFPVPPQRFAQGRILAVSEASSLEITDQVPLEQLGRRRKRLVLDAQLGPLEAAPFDAQYLLLPQGLPRFINEDFERRFTQAMREVSGQSNYAMKRVLYDDRQAPSLYRQVQAIKGALARDGIKRGYILLVLPERADRDLHNYIKRTLWPDLQLQCATANKIRGFYGRPPGQADFQPKPHLQQKLNSYVQNCAFSMLVVNRKWLWMLAAPLHYDLYIGIDVLHRMAGVTMLYQRGQKLFFSNHPCDQKEKLTTREVRDILLNQLRREMQQMPERPHSIVVHRDGRTFASELKGLHLAVSELKREGLLPADVIVGVVDIRKTTADKVRLFEGRNLQEVHNPTIGSFVVQHAQQGIVATTGRPFTFPGTAQPLTAAIVEGDLDIQWALEDIFALSQLIFTAPDACSRLPITIKLADDFLEPIAGAADEEAARYEEEQPEALEEESFLETGDVTYR